MKGFLEPLLKMLFDLLQESSCMYIDGIKTGISYDFHLNVDLRKMTLRHSSNYYTRHLNSTFNKKKIPCFYFTKTRPNSALDLRRWCTSSTCEQSLCKV